MSDDILDRFRADAAGQQRGHLKVFFGAAAGVGKTYAMLSEAHVRQREGLDVVAGYIEPHGRAETEALRQGLEQLPLREIEHRGVKLFEFDLDAALARRPQLILVDELAHTNAPGSRHPKRWQDVEELLDAGINVYTTVNVQHVESLNDVVAQITGVIVRETVPDQIIEEADEIKFVDTPPDDLLQRLREGKIYRADQAERATQSFFRKGNLLALRELALRRTADNVDAQMDDYRRDHAITQPWPTTVRMLVGVSNGPAGGRLIRAARRMAAALRAEWIVAYVETPVDANRPAVDRERGIQTLRLAEQLGAETVTLSGQNAVDELLNYARTRNISKIVVGRSEQPRWRTWLRGSVADQLLRRSGVIDVYVLSGDYGDTEAPPSPTLPAVGERRTYLLALAQITVCTIVAWLAQPYLAEANLVMLYLLGVVGVALLGRRGPAVVSVIGSVLAFDFFLIHPQLSFAVSDTQYVLTFAVMLVVGLLISGLTVRFRIQAEAARARERRTAALYALSRELASVRGLEALLQAIVRHTHEVFDSKVVVLLPVRENRVQPWGTVSGWWASNADARQVFAPNAAEQGVAQWVYEHGEPAGLGTNTLPSSEGLYLPLTAVNTTVGVLGLRPDDQQRLLIPEQRRLLEAFANLAAQALERANLAREAVQARVSAETERTRAALLAAVSHDLRTPLTVITGAAATLRDEWSALDAHTRTDLLDTTADEAARLGRIVNNLLDMTKLESGAITLRKELQPLEEVVGAVLARFDDNEHTLNVDLPGDLPPVPIDAVLIDQVLENLLENAVRYSPPGTPIDLRARVEGPAVLVEVSDRGPGIPPGDEERVFEKFYRGPATGRDGSGLGLAICRAAIEAHGGRIWAEQRTGGGVSVRFTLPRG